MSQRIAIILSCIGALVSFGHVEVASAVSYNKMAFTSPYAPTSQDIPAQPTVQPTSQADPTAQPAPEEFSPEFLHRVTSRVIGEGSFAIPQIACTVRNRWREYHHAGLDAVLRAYYARDVQPQPWQIDIVRRVFTGEIPCPETWWYALSLQDTSYWTPHDRVGMVIVRDERSQIWIYER